MTITEQITKLLDASATDTFAKTDDPNQTLALAYARALWALENDLRQLAAALEGAPQ
ncbi:hypothetical protein P9990_17450 [Prescottella equi]|uniref:hypothetical protein n=1 Tax=Rhodococcus hoagii TaxID=43767 RepID=UPI002575E8E7|nr:hypothetical protein [Prescottella equi]WJJ10357.1 hypothetical protein P9990_17450 [Prescottella equi]